MAYAALVSLSQTIHKFLCDQDPCPISPHENQQILSIHEQIIFFQAFLEDYSNIASSVEGRIRDAANEAEDIIEYFMSEKIRQHHVSKLTKGPEGSQVSDLSGMCFDFKNMKQVAEEIEAIAAEVTEIKNNVRIKGAQQLRDSSSVATSSSSPRLIIGSTCCKFDSAMIGFEDELLAIKTHLCGESSKLQVIPIFGMGGIGKTTLAKNSYDDQLIVEHFQIRAWLTISQDYSGPHILSSLLVSVGAKHFEEMDESSIAENVYKGLKGKRYLIVMDDMWDTKAWDDVRRIFPDDHNGSRIILTTRLLDVATYPNSSSPIHRKHFMDANQSWNLLQQKVFPQGNCPPELEKIGKRIARSCRGLPLATIVIAGLLSTVSQAPASWENIARNVEAVTTNVEQFAETVLSFSYNHLPYGLRPCFLYMGVFPEDYEICVSKLIKLWVAEGFLKLPNESKSYEEVAEEYLEDLVKRSLVLVMKKKSNGKIKSCNLHDLVRDLCIRKAQQEKFVACVKSNYLSSSLQEIVRKQRHVSIASPASLNCLKDIYGSRIHTLICTTGVDYVHQWDYLKNIRLLRVLDVAGAFYGSELFKLSPAIDQIIHLRYLALTYRVKIPAAISKLENLQTLIIYPKEEETGIAKYVQFPPISLPVQVWRIQQLRHLVSRRFDDLPKSEAAHFTLENLQTLSKVENFTCSKEILQMIPHLKKLGISYFADEHVGKYQLQNLRYLHQLERLTLEVKWNSFYAKLSGFHIRIKPVFPTTLKKLTLRGKQCSWQDMGIIGSLPNLQVLKLKNFACSGCTWETSEGEFCQLKFLLIEGSDLSKWITESSHFPSLKCLVLHRCGHLNEIPDSIGEIPTLELIEIDNKNESLVGSAKRIQEEQRENWGNDALQVRCLGN